jgi:iron complex outermembrane receptor protein
MNRIHTPKSIMKIEKTPIAAAIALCLPQFVWAQVATAADGDATLAPVTVRASAAAPYVEPRTRAATRTDSPIEHIPQSVIVVPRSLMEDQDSRSVSDALRNVSNINSIDPRDTNNVSFKVRGFNAATVVDGISMPGYFPNAESVVNMERIDVVKGPSGGLFGSGQSGSSYPAAGGTVAITTLSPEATASRQVGVRVGSYGERGASFDLNQPLGTDLAVRLVGDFARSDSESDGIFFKRTALFPSLSWSPSAATQVVVKLRHQENTTLDYSGLPVKGTLDTSSFRLPRSLNVTATGLPDTVQESDGINIRWDQRLNDVWSFQLIAGRNSADIDQRGVFVTPFGVAPLTGSTTSLAGVRLWNGIDTTSLSPSLTGKFVTGVARHTLSAGVDYEKTTDNAFMTFSNGFGGTLGSIDLLAPNFPAWVEAPTPSPADQQNIYKSTVAYVQDQIDIGSWHLLGSLRHSRISVTDVNPAFGYNNRSTNTKTTPRLGAVYDVNSQVSVFAGHSQAIKVPLFGYYLTPPKPEEFKQTEVGLRFNSLGGVSATVALFDLTRHNATVTDPTTFAAYQTGQQRSKGLDADVRWQATPELVWVAAYSHQTAKTTEDAFAPSQVGQPLFNVPEQQLRLAARYDVRSGALAGWGAGLGLTHRSKLRGHAANTPAFFTPAVTVFDAQVSYRTQAARYAIAIGNLTNKQYYAPAAYFSGGQVIPALPRTVSLSAQFSF